MPACPSAPCFSPKATGSVPLLRDLLSDADVTRLHTLRPAPPVPGLYAAGENCGQVMGDDSPSGANNAWALTSGKLAADAIAAK